MLIFLYIYIYLRFTGYYICQNSIFVCDNRISLFLIKVRRFCLRKYLFYCAICKYLFDIIMKIFSFSISMYMNENFVIY